MSQDQLFRVITDQLKTFLSLKKYHFLQNSLLNISERDDRLFDLFDVLKKDAPELLNICLESIRILKCNEEISDDLYQRIRKIYPSQNKILMKANRSLTELNEKLEENLTSAWENLVICPVTGLYNSYFFHQYLKEEISEVLKIENEDLFMALFNADHIEQYRQQFGKDGMNELFRTVAYLMKKKFPETVQIFRSDETEFAAVIRQSEMTYGEFKSLIDVLRNELKKSSYFIIPMTFSFGIGRVSEFTMKEIDAESLEKFFYVIVNQRIIQARYEGGDRFNEDYLTVENQENKGLVFVLDDDGLHIQVMERFLSQAGFQIIAERDPEKAISLFEEQKIHPDVIISEVVLPKINGFRFRETVLQYSAYQDAVMIFISHKKDEQFFKTAFSLGADYYFQKPYPLAELVVVIESRLKQRRK